jgi:hypothetical protein
LTTRQVDHQGVTEDFGRRARVRAAKIRPHPSAVCVLRPYNWASYAWVGLGGPYSCMHVCSTYRDSVGRRVTTDAPPRPHWPSHWPRAGLGASIWERDTFPTRRDVRRGSLSMLLGKCLTNPLCACCLAQVNKTTGQKRTERINRELAGQTKLKTERRIRHASRFVRRL